MSNQDLQEVLSTNNNEVRMPLLFVGHGSPMNAIEDNEFSQKWKELSKEIPQPSAILCISAHWVTSGTLITAMSKPKTIHDFGGFPQELYTIQYPTQGNPLLANEIKQSVKKTIVGLDEKWGLDHGAWSVLRQMYPLANIPVIEMSLDFNKEPKYHYAMAKELAFLREKGVLIIGSGNIVHNLGMIAWDKIGEPEYGYDWALKANEKIKELIIANKHSELINYELLGREVQLAIPTSEHFLPLLYILALKEENEVVSIFNDKAVMGSLTMTSFKIGK